MFEHLVFKSFIFGVVAGPDFSVLLTDGLWWFRSLIELPAVPEKVNVSVYIVFYYPEKPLILTPVSFLCCDATSDDISD